MRRASQIDSKTLRAGEQILEPSKLAEIRQELEAGDVPWEAIDSAPEERDGEPGSIAKTEPTCDSEKSAWMGAPVKIGFCPSAEAQAAPRTKTDYEGTRETSSTEQDQGPDCLAGKLGKLRRELADEQVSWKNEPSTSQRAAKIAFVPKGDIRQQTAVTGGCDRNNSSWTGAPIVEDSPEVDRRATSAHTPAAESVRRAHKERRSQEATGEPCLRECRSISIPGRLLTILVDRPQENSRERYAGIRNVAPLALGKATGRSREVHRRLGPPSIMYTNGPALENSLNRSRSPSRNVKSRDADREAPG
jgi:hypothetical protein